MTNQNIADRTEIGSLADNRIPSDLAALAGQIAVQKARVEAMPDDADHDAEIDKLWALRAQVAATRARSVSDLRVKVVVAADEMETGESFDSEMPGCAIDLIQGVFRDLLNMPLTAPDTPRPAPDDATGSLLAVLLPVDLYDFAVGEAIVGGARTTAGGRVAISLRRVVAVCQRHAPSANVLIDGAIPARVILHTETWAVVMPNGAQTPSVVEPARLRFVNAAANDGAAA